MPSSSTPSTMGSSSGTEPVKLLALGEIFNFIAHLPCQQLKTSWADGGGIRGLSSLLIVKQVMHKLMVDENRKRKQNGKPPLACLPKPCDCFDLIGGTSTGGYATWFDPHSLQLTWTLQYSRSDAWASSDGRRNSNKTL